VVVLYAEAKLQKSIDLPGSFTISKAKQAGMDAIKEHLKILPGVPLVTLDPDCTDFYPVSRDDNTIIRTLKGNLTMVVYPQPLEGQHLTPSPFVDALQSTIHEVRDVKSLQNVVPLAQEESTERYVKPADNINDILLRRFEAMEEKFGHDIAELKQVNTELMRVNAGLQHDMEEQRRVISGLQDDVEELRRYNAELQHDSAQLKHGIKELSGQMDETNRAVLGDKVAIDKIRRRVLLDMGRDQLAMICGHRDWKEWKDEKAASTPIDDHIIRTVMMTEAEVILQNSTDASEYWKAVGQDRSTLRFLIYRSHIRTDGDIVAHTSTEEAIAESVLALTALSDRAHMITIFRAVYNNEP
jgi:soluble cytochrome b562